MEIFSVIASSLTLNAPSLFGEEHLNIPFLEWLSNSIFVSFIVVALVLYWARASTIRMEIVPGRTQNLFEAIIEALYEMLEGIVGKHMVHRTFSLLATLFIFILISNWFALLPGVGSVGWGKIDGPFHYISNIEVPFLRPTTADLNMTLGMAAVFMALWFYWTVSETGLWNFFKHEFGVKGGLKGLGAMLLAPIFFFVGIIEIISILFRPVSLSLRLFGNVYAGETLLGSMINLGHELHLPAFVAYIMSVIVPIPFYFLELLVGVLQALVFTLLCAVYIQLSTSHDEEEAH